MKLRMLIFCLAFWTLLPNLSNAQWTIQDAMKFESFQNLFDERGYSKNNSMQNNGNIDINTENGTVLYNYPIYNQEINGSQLKVDLNYCGDVSYTSYILFDKGLDDQLDVSGWKTSSTNRPVWLLGVNGFAVQAFSFSKMFVNRPDLFFMTPEQLALHYDSDNNGTLVFKDKDINWVINGYDVCNRMYCIASPIANKFRMDVQDLIRILRSDGSVLELRNSFVPDGEPNYGDDRFYTGDYYNNTPNSKAFGKVSYLDEVNGDEIPHNYASPLIAKNKPYIPRVLRYYPGDGLEYIFYEYLTPFGPEVIELRDPSSGAIQDWSRYTMGHNATYNGFNSMDGCPSIFYLKEIRNQNSHVAYLEYTKHIDFKTNEYPFSAFDQSKGRAFIKSINGIINFHFNGYYSPNNVGKIYCNIQLPKKDFEIECDNASTNALGYSSLNGEDIKFYKDLEPQFDLFKNEIFPYHYMENYHTIVPHVTKIKEGLDDNLIKSTSFGYKPINTKINYNQNPFLIKNVPPNTNSQVELKNYALETIYEPTKKYELSYFENECVNWTPTSTVDREFTSTNNIQSIFPETIKLHLLHYIVKKVDIKDYSNILIRTENYIFKGHDMVTGNHWTDIITTVDVNDPTASQKIIKSYYFEKTLLPPIIQRDCREEPVQGYIVNTNQTIVSETFQIDGNNKDIFSTYTRYACPEGHLHLYNEDQNSPNNNCFF